MAQIILTAGTILFGGYFFFMGLNHFVRADMLTDYARSKGLPIPGLANIFAGIFLILGGIGIIIGDIYTQIGTIMVVIFLLITNITIHSFWKSKDPQSKMMDMTHFLKNWALIGACLIILAVNLLNQ